MMIRFKTGFSTTIYRANTNKFYGNNEMMIKILSRILSQIGPQHGRLIPAFVSAIREFFPEARDKDIIYYDTVDSSEILPSSENKY